MLSINLLGEFQIPNDDKPQATLNSPQAQSFFAYLLLHRGHPNLLQLLVEPGKRREQLHPRAGSEWQQVVCRRQFYQSRGKPSSYIGKWTVPFQLYQPLVIK